MDGVELRQYLQQSVRKLKACTTLDELRGSFVGVIFPLGLQQFAYTKFSDNSVWFDKSVHTFAEEWTELYQREGFARIDPVFAMAKKEADPFFWSAEQLCDNQAVQDFFQKAGKFGLSWGVTTRLKTSAKAGILVTCTASGSSHLPEGLKIEQLVACCRLLSEAFHQSALVINSEHGLTLRPREKEVLQLSALGMSGSEIATVIGVSPIYVAEISRNLIQKFGVRNKLAALWRASELELVDH